MRRMIGRIGEWFDRRLQLAAPIREAVEHPVPRRTASWWYVFGSAALTVFLLQLVTGILLALIYVPSAGEAWSSLQALNHDVTLGWFIRAMHGWGSNFMVAIVLIHMMQVFLFGAYKFPRELTWIIGVFLLLMTLGMAFSGQVLRFDQDAYWGLGIGASIASRVPILGPAIVKLMLGGPIIAGATLSRFFTLHVFVIPGLLIGFVALHVLMVLKLGINEWPMPGRIVRRATYETEYHELTKERWRAVLSLCGLERPVLRGICNPGSRCMCVVLRALRADRPARSDDHSDCAEAGLLLPVALCLALAASAVARDTGTSHRPGGCDCWVTASSLSIRRRRKELAATADCGFDRDVDRDHARNLHSSRRVRTLESAHERLERRSRSAAIPATHNRAGAARRFGLSG